MSEVTLKARSALDGFEKQFDGVTVREVTGLAIISIAVPNDGRDALAGALASAFDAEIPEIGKSSTSANGGDRFLGLQQGQFFMLTTDTGPGTVTAVGERLKDTAYLTDQSDSWAMISVTGDKAGAALERICPIDLHPGAFAPGTVARTAMEHIAAIIVREGPADFLILSPRSSARSFLHAVETSIDNIL